MDMAGPPAPFNCQGQLFIPTRSSLLVAVSAGLMRVQIAALSGWTSIHLLFAIFGLTAVTMLFGWLMETVNGDRVDTYTVNQLVAQAVCF
jgi:Heliorhodopsin